MAVQCSFYNFTFLCGAALPGLTGDVVVAVTLATLWAVLVSEPCASRLPPHTHRHRHTHANVSVAFTRSLHRITYFLHHFKTWLNIKVNENSNDSSLMYQVLTHLQANISQPHHYSRTHWVGHICLHWGWDLCHRSTPRHRVHCRNHRGLQDPDSWVGGRQGHMGCNDCLGDTLELEWG